jgi:DNA-binding NtrC family response regulator
MKASIESLLKRARGFFLRDAAPSVGRVSILALLTEEGDRRLLAAAANRNHWVLAFAGGYDEARLQLEKIQQPVVLCDRDSLERDWCSVVEGLATCSPHSSILLVSKVADDYLWNEVVRRGGYDILSKPLEEDEVVRVVKLAWSYWNSTKLTTR